MKRVFIGFLLALISFAARAENATVSIDKYQFLPAKVTIKAGDTVTWVNNEKRTSHSVLFEDVPESDRFFPEEKWQRKFDKPGLHPYVCGPHKDMKGEVEVLP